MNKKGFILFLIGIIILLSVAVLSPNEATENEDVFYSFVDSDNNEVKLYERPKRVAVLFSSLAETWKNAGGNIAVSVGETVERRICKEDIILADKGAGKNFDIEILLTENVDFVILSADVAFHKKAADTLKKAGIPTALLRIDTFEDYLSALKVFTDITGKEENYKLYGESVKREIEKILSENKKTKGEKILFIRSGSTASSAKAKRTEDNFTAKIISDFGFINIADKSEILIDTISAEAVLKENPKHIFISIMGDEEAGKIYINSLFEREEYKALDAVKEGNVYFLPKELFHFKPCHRWAESYRYIYETIN